MARKWVEKRIGGTIDKGVLLVEEWVADVIVDDLLNPERDVFLNGKDIFSVPKDPTKVSYKYTPIEDNP